MKKHHSGFVIWKKKNARGKTRYHVGLFGRNGTEVWSVQPKGYGRLRDAKRAIAIAMSSGMLRTTII